MKKISYLLLLCMLLLGFSFKVLADDFDEDNYTKLPGVLSYKVEPSNFSKGDTITLYLIANLPSSVEIQVSTLIHDFDHDLLQITSVTSDINSDVTWRDPESKELGGGFSVVSSNTKTGKINLFVIKFKVLDDFDSTIVRFSRITGANANDLYLFDNQNIKINKDGSTEDPGPGGGSGGGSGSGSGESGGGSGTGSSGGSGSGSGSTSGGSGSSGDKSSDVVSPDTGVGLPTVIVALLSGSFVIIKKQKQGWLYRI